MDKWIIFDFDGTLADTLAAGVAILNTLAGKFGFKKVMPEDAKRLKGMLPREILKDVGISLWKLPFVARAARRQLRGQADVLKLYDGVPEALAELKARGYNLAILTTGSLQTAEAILKNNNIGELFNVVHAEGNLFGKGRALKRLMKRHKINPRDAVYVGDEVRDADASRQAGVKFAAVTWGVNSKEILQKQNPDFLIEEPEDLLTMGIIAKQ